MSAFVSLRSQHSIMARAQSHGSPLGPGGFFVVLLMALIVACAIVEVLR